ncbi:reverse transcriptase domain-containing protein [Tanacetum coccineum]
MIKEGIALGHKVSGSGIEVDKAKNKAISKLPYPTNVKAIRSFLKHADFYRRFIKDFSEIARPMTQLLVKDAPFNFSEECIYAFKTLKRELTQAPIMIKPDWSLPFEIMCDASDYAVGAVLGQRIDKHFKPIHYASKTIREAQETTQLLKKSFWLLSLHSTNSVNTWSYPRPSSLRIILPYGAENLAADHRSRLENPDLGKLTRAKIRDLFPEERLMAISDKNNEPCVLTESYEDVWPEMKQHKFFNSVTADHPEDTMASPPPQGKFSRPDSTGHISFAMHTSWDIFPLQTEIKYILVAIDYVSKWVEAQAFPTSAARNVVNFLRRLFTRFGIPKALISDRGTHFWNHQMEKAMKRYGVVHRFSIAYHPQTNGQVKNMNRAINHILKKTIGNNKKDWSYKLDDALWAFRMAFKTPLGTTSFRIIYDKACYLPVELEHKAYWAIKNCNMDLTKAGKNQFLQINELDEIQLDAYESSISYKERTKRWNDKRIKLPINQITEIRYFSLTYDRDYSL